jgi:DNA-binding CsgD family transcriptional regulator
LLEAARGNDAKAQDSLDAALREHEGLGQPFELARTLLVAGSIHRRARRKAEARRCLTEAAMLFNDLGARLWSERAGVELARISGRAPGGSGLTPTERRVAELVAAGSSNREVADHLFITVRTVETNLTRIYQKLGVRSRTQLVRGLAAQPPEVMS